MQILIYGAPGAGKTTSSKLIHQKTKIVLLEGDYLREVQLPKEIGETNDSFLYIGTKQAWRHFGELTPDNAIKGLIAVRKSVQPYINRELISHKDLIFEAAFLDPKLHAEENIFLVVTLDEAKHREQFFRDRKHGGHELEDGFIASRYIQEYLISEARKHKITVIQNDGDKSKLLAEFKI